MNNNMVTAKELAKLLGVSVATVNYYTNLAFFNPRDRKGSRRLYDKNEIISIYNEVHRLRKEGYPLRLVKQRLDTGYRI